MRSPDCDSTGYTHLRKYIIARQNQNYLVKLPRFNKSVVGQNSIFSGIKTRSFFW